MFIVACLKAGRNSAMLPRHDSALGDWCVVWDEGWASGAALGGSAVAAALVQSASSFGFGLVLLALLPMVGMAVREAVVLVTLLVVPNLAIAVWRLRRRVDLRQVGWLLAGVPLGIPPGLYLLAKGPDWALRGALGVVLVVAALEPFFRERMAARRGSRRWAFVAGVCSGALGAALSTGGPPVVLYFYRLGRDKEETKACVMATFVGTVSMRLVAYVVQAPLTGEALLTSGLIWQAVVYSPAVVVGTAMGEWVFGSVSQRGFRLAVAAMLVVCGLYQLGKAAGLA